MNIYPRDYELTGFQEHSQYDETIDLQTDFVMVYGLDENTPAKINEWKSKGYIIHLMTGISWGEYGDYLNGKYDGDNHWSEAQADSSGIPVLHGPNVPYMVPTISFTRYLCEKIRPAVDAGVEAIHLEEPEFWVRSGYSEAFKKEWEMYYRLPWQPPHESPDAQYKASKLKTFLFTRCIFILGSELKSYAKEKYNRDLKLYIPTHSVINYAQWSIVSPESMFMDSPIIDGYIAQVWTGTARTPNIYNGIKKERTFATAFLEYGIMQELVQSSNLKMWFLHDPIEDNPSYEWDNYSYNYFQTLTASLFQPKISRYEVCPWPNRIFNGKYPHIHGIDAKPLPQSYGTTMLTVMNTLRNMKQDRVKWGEGAANDNTIGVFISDTAMYQRVYPENDQYRAAHNEDIENFSCFYGLCLPFIFKGIPVRPLQLENLHRFFDYLNDYNVIILSYEFIKPQFSELHYTLLAWVKSGGVLIYVGNDADSYNKISSWWNSGKNNYSSPAAHLFEVMGLTGRVNTLKRRSRRLSQIIRPTSEGIYEVGKGIFAVYNESPAMCAREPDYANYLRNFVYDAAAKKDITFKEKNYFMLRRGPYKIVSVLNEENNENLILKGNFINLLTPDLDFEKLIIAEPGENLFLYDLDAKRDEDTEILAISARVEDLVIETKSMTFTAKAPAGIVCACRIYVSYSCNVTVDGTEISADKDPSKKTLLFKFNGNPVGSKIEITKRK
ncbi:MAG: hypothetical protein K0S55_733 [Clostridia bacterium]|nr:hypothetical protein [Clostridia bacterium]